MTAAPEPGDALRPTRLRASMLVLLLAVLALQLVLSTMRAPYSDESLYLRDARVMAECLQAGRWYGNEAVGLHGSLFKLPTALLFIAFGPSVWLATATTIALAAIALLLIYRHLGRVLGSHWWAVAACWLVGTNFLFTTLSVSFLRGIPALLATVLLFDALLLRRNRWVVGLCLLLVLEAKEYLFFMYAPGVLLWILLDARAEAREPGGRHAAWATFVRWTAAMLPAGAYVVLMLTSGVVPLNSFLTAALGLTHAGFGVAGTQFSPALAATNKWNETLSMPAFAFGPGLAGDILRALNLLLRYLAKPLYPSLFSFAGMPRAVAFPAIAASVAAFRAWSGDRGRQALCLVVWSQLLVLLFMVSQDRYMFPTYPWIYLFFLLFLRGDHIGRRRAWLVWWVTAAAVAAGYAFEAHHAPQKIVLNVTVLGAIAAAIHVRGRAGRLAALAPVLPVVGLGLVSLLVTGLFQVRHLIGQVNMYRRFGRNWQCERFAAQFGPHDRIWHTPISWRALPDFYRGKRAPSPEWRWRLPDWVPKRRMLARTTDTTWRFHWQSEDEFRDRVRRYGITHLAVLTADVERHGFPTPGRVAQILALPWAVLEREVQLKGMRMAILRVDPVIHGGPPPAPNFRGVPYEEMADEEP